MLWSPLLWDKRTTAQMSFIICAIFTIVIWEMKEKYYPDQGHVGSGAKLTCDWDHKLSELLFIFPKFHHEQPTKGGVKQCSTPHFLH